MARVLKFAGVGSSNQLEAFDPDTGTELWQRYPFSPSSSSLMQDGKVVVAQRVTLSGGDLVVLGTDGAVVQRLSGALDGIFYGVGLDVDANDNIYVALSRDPTTSDHSVLRKYDSALTLQWTVDLSNETAGLFQSVNELHVTGNGYAFISGDGGDITYIVASVDPSGVYRYIYTDDDYNVEAPAEGSLIGRFNSIAVTRGTFSPSTDGFGIGGNVLTWISDNSGVPSRSWTVELGDAVNHISLGQGGAPTTYMAVGYYNGIDSLLDVYSTVDGLRVHGESAPVVVNGVDSISTVLGPVPMPGATATDVVFVDAQGVKVWYADLSGEYTAHGESTVAIDSGITTSRHVNGRLVFSSGDAVLDTRDASFARYVHYSARQAGQYISANRSGTTACMSKPASGSPSNFAVLGSDGVLQRLVSLDYLIKNGSRIRGLVVMEDGGFLTIESRSVESVVVKYTGTGVQDWVYGTGQGMTLTCLDAGQSGIAVAINDVGIRALNLDGSENWLYSDTDVSFDAIRVAASGAVYWMRDVDRTLYRVSSSGVADGSYTVSIAVDMATTGMSVAPGTDDVYVLYDRDDYSSVEGWAIRVGPTMLADWEVETPSTILNELGNAIVGLPSGDAWIQPSWEDDLYSLAAADGTSTQISISSIDAAADLAYTEDIDQILSGTVLDENGVGVARTVRIYDSSNGALIAEVTSSAADGSFEYAGAMPALVDLRVLAADGSGLPDLAHSDVTPAGA